MCFCCFPEIPVVAERFPRQVPTDNFWGKMKIFLRQRRLERQIFSFLFFKTVYHMIQMIQSRSTTAVYFPKQSNLKLYISWRSLKVCNFIKKSLQHRCFSVTNTKFLRTPFLESNSLLLLLYTLGTSGLQV